MLFRSAPGSECVFDQVGAEVTATETGDQFFQDSSQLFITDKIGLIVERRYAAGCGGIRKDVEGVGASQCDGRQCAAVGRRGQNPCGEQADEGEALHSQHSSCGDVAMGPFVECICHG